MNKRRTSYLLSLLMFSMGLFGNCSCNDRDEEYKQNPEVTPPVVTEKSIAVFDYFNYKGEDTYYKDNPLSDDTGFYNPILPGWYSDPSICTNGTDYFLITSTFIYYPGVPLFHSKDLVNWRQVGHVLDRPSQLQNFQGQGTGGGGIYAPAISYNPHNQTYYMITTNVGAGNFFVKTKDPFGSWSDPVYLRDVHGIDPSFFFDEDGRAYIINNDAPQGPSLYSGHRALWIREFDVDTDKTVGTAKMVVDGGVDINEKPSWIEGPHIYKVNGRYLLMAAEGGTGPNHREVVFSSDSPMGPYTPWSGNPILTQRHLSGSRPNPITCVGHADLVQAAEGDWWSVFLGCRPVNNQFENLGRETFIMPVRWSEDGFPYMTKDDEVVPMTLQRPGVKRDKTLPSGNFEKNDNFVSETLDMEWITLRASAAELYSLTENPGYLTLKCADVSSTEKRTPAFICRRLQHHQFRCITSLFFYPSDENDAAGMLVYKDETHQYFLSVRMADTKRKISLEKIGEKSVEVLATKEIDNTDKPIRLEVSSPEGLTFVFRYAVGEEDWKLLCDNISTYYLSTSNSFGFTGTTIGMYATRK